MTKSPVIQENSGKTRAPGINGLGGVSKICIISVSIGLKHRRGSLKTPAGHYHVVST